jgi:hypothetical protein
MEKHAKIQQDVNPIFQVNLQRQKLFPNFLFIKIEDFLLHLPFYIREYHKHHRRRGKCPKYILFDQTHGTDNIGWYSIWVRFLTQRGDIVHIHTSGPITSTVLAGYDVLVIHKPTIPTIHLS